MHVTLSRTKAGLDTYETVGVQEGPTYANVKQTKSQTHRQESLTHEDGTAKQTQSEDGYCTPLESSPLDATNKLQAHGVENAEKQENKDHVYAVVHKDAKGRNSAASVHARTPCSKRLEPAIRPYSDVEPVNRSSSADPANHSDARPSSVEPANHSQSTLVVDEKKGYLYAVVDKANKKKRPPQVNIKGTLCLFVCLFVLFLVSFFNFFFAILIKDFCSLNLSVTIISCCLKNNPKISLTPLLIHCQTKVTIQVNKYHNSLTSL